MKYDDILFDLDGTLTDPGEGITNSVAYALKKNGITPPPREALYPFIGPPLNESFMKYFGFSEADSFRCVDDYREYYRDRGIFENRLYEGIPELLKSLKSAGRTVLLATSKPTVFAAQILEHFGIADCFAGVYGSELDGSRTHKADVIAYALQKSGIDDVSHAVMVGDRFHDVVGAKQNGISTIGVLYGYGSQEELENAGALCTVGDVVSLQRALLGA